MTIISFKHRFIFVKTRKVGGTSVEAALRTVTGPDDIVTTLTPRDEYHCAVQGYHARNYASNDLEEDRFTEMVLAERFDAAMTFTRSMRKQYNEHMKAREIRRKLGRRTFNDFYRFSIERDPYTWLISIAGYDRDAYNNGTLSPLAIEQLRERIVDRLSRRGVLDRANYGYYTINRKLAVDRIIRYEHLETDLAEVLKHLGIGAAPVVPRLKENPQAVSAAQIYTPEIQALVQKKLKPVFELTGYPDTIL